MVASAQRQAGRPAPLRLTRRGRVVVLALLIIVASTVGALLATASRASDPGPSAPTPGAVVQPYGPPRSGSGRAAPYARPWVVVAEIHRFDGVGGGAAHPGPTPTVAANR